jgi:hypothetical protein
VKMVQPTRRMLSQSSEPIELRTLSAFQKRYRRRSLRKSAEDADQDAARERHAARLHSDGRIDVARGGRRLHIRSRVRAYG